MTLKPTEPAQRRRHGTIAAKQERTAWFFLAPALAVLAVFMVWPLIQAGYLSFTNYSLLAPAEFVGLDNYVRLAQDDVVLNAFGNTLVYAAVVTPITVALSLGIALFLNQAIAFRGFTRTAVFLPFIVSLGIIAIAWSFLLDPNIGLFSYWAGKIGISSEQGWLTDPDLAMPAVMFVGVWKFVGFYMVMYLAGLQSIPDDLFEASRLDGANSVQRFRHVTWPLLSNQTMLVSVMAVIANLQAFDQIYVMTRGGPFFQTETLVVLIQRLGFGQLEFGYGAAISWVLMGFVFVLSMLQYAYFKRKAVTY